MYDQALSAISLPIPLDAPVITIRLFMPFPFSCIYYHDGGRVFLSSRFTIPRERYLAGDKNMKGPKNCFNCRSENIIGPYKYVDSGVYIAIFNIIRQEAYVCIDCGHTMLFTRKEHEGKVIKEAVRQQIISQ